MKYILIVLSLSTLISCSTSKEDTVSREVASFQPECSIEKHPEQPIYRLKMYNKTYNQFWYTAKEVEGLYNNFVLQGRCL